MSLEKFIRGKIDKHRHVGKASNRRRLESAINKEVNWREQIPQDQEIVLFINNPLDKK